MPSTRRRFLAALGAVATGGLAGCASLTGTETPAGSLRFENRDDLPHTVAAEVVAVGDRLSDGEPAGDPIVTPDQRNLHAAASVPPNSTRTYRAVFTSPVWYQVRFTVDGRESEASRSVVEYNPVRPDRDGGLIVAGEVDASGEMSWSLESTSNYGSLSPDGDAG